MRGVTAKITILILTIGMIGMPPALAKEGSPWAQAITTLLKGTDRQPLQQRDRVKVARNIAEFCRPIADAIPTLAPREEDWLDIELQSPRFMAATKTIEYSKSQAGIRSRNCLHMTEKLLKILEIDTDIARRSEALLWGLLADQILEPDFHWNIDNLMRKGVVQFTEEDMDEIKLAPSLGRAIVQSILVPHLIDEAGARPGK